MRNSFRNNLVKLKRNLAFRLHLKPLSTIDRQNDNPLNVVPETDINVFKTLFAEAKNKSFPIIDKFERSSGYSVKKSWLDDLALHTQIVRKKSVLNYQHGRILYATLRQRISNLSDSSACLTVFETGTARGYSAVCMSRALIDANQSGRIITVDILPHETPIYWNCIDDLDGKKSRRMLLNPWETELQNIYFFQEETSEVIKRLSLSRIHFSFLDASHTYEDVMEEFLFVSTCQRTGDMIVFDDVTQLVFPGVVEAVKNIEKNYPYNVHHIKVDEERSYAVATRE